MRSARNIAAALVATGLLAAGCAQDPGQAGNAATGGGATVSQKADTSLHDQLPEAIKKAGKIVSVNSGAFPPYNIPGANGSATQMEGASADLEAALGQILGVKIDEVTVEGLSGVLSGIEAKRYDMAFGPIGDFEEREGAHDFVDWVQEFVVFAVPKGNPKHVTGLASTCGLRIAVQAGGSAEKVIKGEAADCTKAGKPKLTVQSFKDQPTSILAVRSGRSDAFFSSQAPLTYFTKQSKGALELAGTGQKNGFDDLLQGAVVPKGSPLRDVLLKGFQKLFDNGTYAQVMKKWGLDANKIDAPGVNLATTKQ